MHQRDVTVPNWVLALLWYPPLCLLSKEVTLRDPFKTHGPGRVWTRRGGRGPSCEWFTSARNLRCDGSLPLPQDCPQYIPKGKPTPASKLAFVIMFSPNFYHCSHGFYPFHSGFLPQRLHRFHSQRGASIPRLQLVGFHQQVVKLGQILATKTTHFGEGVLREYVNDVCII